MADAPRLRVVLEGRDAPEPVRTDSTQEEPKAPAYGVRAEEPGPRGCWARKSNGDLCGAAPRRGEDYCNAHSGYGVAQNPAEWSAKGRVASAESRRRRAALRLALGHTRLNSPRGLLRAAVFADAERVVAAALSPIGDPRLGSSAKQRAALALLDAADPPLKAELDVPIDLGPEGVAGLGLAQLRALAEQVGTPPLPLPTST